jgi:hypothetical protein
LQNFKQQIEFVFNFNKFYIKKIVCPTIFMIIRIFKTLNLNLISDEAEKQTSFSDFFKICCTVQNVAKGNKIAKTGLKNVFFIH